MDGIEILLRAIGAFYMFAGYVATRAALTGMVIDRAIAAIGQTAPPRGETARTILLLGVSALVFMGGLALLLCLQAATWIFVASVILQGVFFGLLAPFYLDGADPPDPKGRRQSLNAFVIYTAATVFVVWAHARGVLLAPDQVPNALLAAGGACGAAYAIYLGQGLFHVLRPARADG